MEVKTKKLEMNKKKMHVPEIVLYKSLPLVILPYLHFKDDSFAYEFKLTKYITVYICVCVKE